ncbi:rhodanese-like domain-containing protein [Romeria aff. gracilis LEGE 07310]|uniref:Rhodanese-like domain-containing protein n=2 Tax=Vasconcelosia TaxID=3366328 RepID=A0A8J7ARA5_9CYAN|nr:rhodanese-like domain-containing protein [Romeria aff. gracilis LEGE 07310]
MSGINEGIEAAKQPARQATPAPAKFDTVSSASDLKSRLDWGEPALTIIDVRDRDAFNEERIMGAVSMPSEELVDRAPETLEPNRDIYVYGDSDELTSQAAMQLSDAGFKKVSALRGGLPAWKAIGGTTEGRVR